MWHSEVCPPRRIFGLLRIHSAFLLSFRPGLAGASCLAGGVWGCCGTCWSPARRLCPGGPARCSGIWAAAAWARVWLSRSGACAEWEKNQRTTASSRSARRSRRMIPLLLRDCRLDLYEPGISQCVFSNVDISGQASRPKCGEQISAPDSAGGSHGCAPVLRRSDGTRVPNGAIRSPT